MNPEPKVTLVSWTQFPLETVWTLWWASKNEKTLDEIQGDKPTSEQLEELFKAVIAQHIPIGESINFVFMVEHVSVSWREQAVRHRIGVVPSPERLGADIGMLDVHKIPDLASSSWWSQSMRIQDMTGFAERGEYRMPASVLESGAEAYELFKGTMESIGIAYKRLLGMGVPMEDARELMPLGAQHRISWALNINSLQHIVGKRGCWILQLGIWGPVIMGMINELVTKVHPIFSELVCPPCMCNDTFTGCVFMEENRRRMVSADCHAPCSLYVAHHVLPPRVGLPGPITPCHDDGIPMFEAMVVRAKQYELFWQRDPFTGKRTRR